MKISLKITIPLTLLTLTLFSLYSYMMIDTSTKTLLENTRNEHTNAHILKRYTLHNLLLESYMNQESISDDIIKEQMMSLDNYQKQDGQEIAVFNAYKKRFYDNMEESHLPILDSFVNGESENSYMYKEMENKQILFIYSFIEVGNAQLHLLTSYDLSFIFALKDKQIHQMLWFMLFFGFVSFALITLLVHRLTKPIALLNRTSHDIAQGSYTKRTCIQSDDEIGELSMNFDAMADAIEMKINELENMVDHQNQFIADFSHEMKTPMTSIVGYADVLTHFDVREEDRLRAYAYISKEGKRLDELAHKLLDLRMMDHKQLVKEHIPVQFLAQSVKEMSEQEFKDIQIVIDMQEQIILGDKDLLICLLHNLVTNAIKAKPKDACVYITGRIVDAKYTIEVIDHGIGISQEHLQHLKEAFYMVDKSRDRRNGGSGLGLTLCDKIAKYHHTHLQFTSTFGEGTSVSFQLEVDHA